MHNGLLGSRGPLRSHSVSSQVRFLRQRFSLAHVGYAASGRFRGAAPRHFGGRPRRGLSAFQSTVQLHRRPATSAAVVFRAEAGAASRHQARTTEGLGHPAVLEKNRPGWAASVQPWLYPCRDRTAKEISATNSRQRTGGARLLQSPGESGGRPQPELSGGGAEDIVGAD